MRFNSTRRTIRVSALGPAEIANRMQISKNVNLGIPNRPSVYGKMLLTGGTLGCLCGPGIRRSLNGVYLSGNAPPQVVIGPIAARIIALRKSGVAPQVALLDALTALNSTGVKVVTPAIHLQLAAGLQPFPGGALNGLGAATVGAAVTGASVGTAAVAIGIGVAAMLGQTIIPIPGVGAVIGAIVFEAMQLMKRHVGLAEAAWTSPGFYQSLRVTNGRDYDEKQFSEAFKGMMDTGNNIVPGCGPDRHKNPDCLLGPMAAVIAQGYLSNTVPLTATTSQVFANVVKPWLLAGAGGLVNGAALAGESTQLLMMMAATDRYLAGQAMTRGDMPAYAGQGGAHTPSLVQALQPMLAQPMTTTPQMTQATVGAPAYQSATNAGGPAFYLNNPPLVNVQDATAGGAPSIYPVATSPTLMPQTTGATGYPSTYPPGYSPAGPAIGYNMPPGQTQPISSPGQQTATLPWGAIIAAGAALLTLGK